jgi:hypothetical protein
MADDGYIEIERAEYEWLNAQAERLAEAEAVVYALCDAWGGDTPQVPDPGGVVFAVWLESAGYHAKYRMNPSPLAYREERQDD